MSGWRLLVHNGAVQPGDPGIAAEFLRCKPTGAYTTTKTVEGASCLILWEKHLQRLSNSVRLLTNNVTLDTTVVKTLVHPSLYAGLARALSLRKEDEEVVVTVLACTGDSEWLDASGIYVHLAGQASKTLLPAKVAVMGPGREKPLAKSSEWARTREVLEKHKPEGVNEVILSNDGKTLLEGLVTNFFLVVEHNEPPGFFVQTASLEDGVLAGTIRQLVIDACNEMNIPVRESAPCWDDRHSWREAFITSSVRLIQSVEAIQMPVRWNTTYDPLEWSKTEWEHTFLQGPGPLTKMLEKEVMERVKKSSFSLLKAEKKSGDKKAEKKLKSPQKKAPTVTTRNSFIKRRAT